jgi:hypothetical protein
VDAPPPTTREILNNGMVKLTWDQVSDGKKDSVCCQFPANGNGYVHVSVVQPDRSVQYNGMTNPTAARVYLHRWVERFNPAPTEAPSGLQEAADRLDSQIVAAEDRKLQEPAVDGKIEGEPLERDQTDFGPAVNKLLDQVGPSLGFDDKPDDDS